MYTTSWLLVPPSASSYISFNNVYRTSLICLFCPYRSVPGASQLLQDAAKGATVSERNCCYPTAVSPHAFQPASEQEAGPFVRTKYPLTHFLSVS